jgi:CubicO group peptidase (beta-lactamase class C family)
MEIVLSQPPAAPPGTRMIYTNFGYTIAGAFAERVTGEDWEGLMRRLLFDPLEMRSAGFGPPGITRYAILHLRGARGETGLLLSPATFQALHRDWYGQGYALGWEVVASDRLGGLELTHAGATTAWYAEILLAPRRNVAFLVATNSGCDGSLRACNAVINTMIRRYA